MALTVCSLSPALVTPYHLLESRFHVHSFGSLHTPVSFLLSTSLSRSRTSSSMVNSWRWGSFFLIRLLNNSSVGLTPVVRRMWSTALHH